MRSIDAQSHALASGSMHHAWTVMQLLLLPVLLLLCDAADR
jgi:hypothetical protein